MFWRFCNSLAGASIILWRASLYLNKKLPLCVPAYNLEVLLISHLTNPDHLNDGTDFYFGDLATKLNVSGVSTHTFLINHCQANVSHIGSMRRKETTILPAFQSLHHEIFNILRLIIAALTLPEADAPIKNNRFHRLAKVAQFGSRAIGDYRIGQMIATVVKTLQPRVIIYTYEGHGWERIVAETAHNLAIPAHVIGYQHAVLFPGDKSLYHDHGRGTVPDHIFATGDVTRDILARNMKFCQGQITTLGSVKCQTSSSEMHSSADGICLLLQKALWKRCILWPR